MSGDPVVAVPADLELEEPLAGPVTFRMAGWLAASAAGVALLALSRDHVWVAVPGVVLLVGGLVGAMWRPGDRPVGAWLWPLWSYRRRQRAARRTLRTNTMSAEPDVLAAPATGDSDAPKMPGAPETSEVPEVPGLATTGARAPHRQGRVGRRRASVLVLTLLAAGAIAVSMYGPLRSQLPLPGRVSGPEPGDLPSTAATPARPSASVEPAPSSPTAPASPLPSARPDLVDEPFVLAPADPFWPWGLEVEPGGGWLGCGC